MTKLLQVCESEKYCISCGKKNVLRIEEIEGIPQYICSNCDTYFRVSSLCKQPNTKLVKKPYSEKQLSLRAFSSIRSSL